MSLKVTILDMCHDVWPTKVLLPIIPLQHERAVVWQVITCVVKKGCWATALAKSIRAK
jgi:hypothetical protein